MTEQIKNIMDKLRFGIGLDGRIYLYYPERSKDYIAKYKRDVTEEIFGALVDWAFKYSRSSVVVTIKRSGKKYVIIIKEEND